MIICYNATADHLIFHCNIHHVYCHFSFYLKTQIHWINTPIIIIKIYTIDYCCALMIDEPGFQKLGFGSCVLSQLCLKKRKRIWVRRLLSILVMDQDPEINVSKGLNASWTRLSFIICQIFDDFSEWSMPKVLCNLEKSSSKRQEFGNKWRK